MTIQSLKDLYVAELQDIYDAEDQIEKILPVMASSCSSQELRAVFEDDSKMTRHQKERLERVFGMLSIQPGKRRCEGLEGILKEGREFIENGTAPHVLDAALIGSAQRVKHYEMCVYGSLCAYAKLLGFSDQAVLLRRSLSEEGAVDHRLTDIAMRAVNAQAF